MIISKLIRYTLAAAACVGTLSLNSCGSDSSSPSSTTENTLDLISPYQITLQWNGANEVLTMRPNTATDGSVNIEVLSDSDEIITTQSIYEWVTFPNDETNQAELKITHSFFENVDPKIFSVYVYTIYFTFTDTTTANATIKVVKTINSDTLPETWVNDQPATFSRPLY